MAAGRHEGGPHRTDWMIMQFRLHPIARLAASLACGALGVTLLMGTPAAHAAPTTVTAVTTIQNDPDSGNGGFWSDDQITRNLTVSVAADQTGVPLGSVRYTAHVADTGTFETIPGAHTPNQVVAGQHIAHVVSGTLAGTADYTITAPSPAEALSSLPNAGIVTALNDGFAPPSGAQSLSGWPEGAFTPQLPAGDLVLNHFSYSYTTQAGENWLDSDTNGDGNLVSDGNITGIEFVPPALPALSRGHAVATSKVHETVCFTLSGAATEVHFLILGPGKINGHQGWIPAHLGVNCGYYYGLEANHTYLVYYVPVTGPGSQVQVPGTHAGHVTFVS